MRAPEIDPRCPLRTSSHEIDITESDSDSSIDKNTNRGYKLKRKARFVKQGRLAPPTGPGGYKEVRRASPSLTFEFETDATCRLPSMVASNVLSSTRTPLSLTKMDTKLTVRMTKSACKRPSLQQWRRTLTPPFTSNVGSLASGCPETSHADRQQISSPLSPP